MFTGIIEALGHISASEQRGGDRRIHIATKTLNLSDVKIGDSICVSGVCLTVVELSSSGFGADVSSETLAKTVLGEQSTGTRVNLEKALTPSTHLGGHLVSGHIDGVGKVQRFYQDARSWRLHIQAPQQLARYIAQKGSICVDGVSLTVNHVNGTEFDLNIVPHTLQVTTIADYRPGHRVNLEVDIIARYLERLLLGEHATDGGVTEQLLRARGFIRD